MRLSTGAIHNGDESHACDLVPHRLLAGNPADRGWARQLGELIYRHRIVSNKPLIMKANATA